MAVVVSSWQEGQELTINYGNSSLFVDQRQRFPGDPLHFDRCLPATSSQEAMDAADREYRSLFFEQQRIIDKLEDVKTLRRASQTLVNLTSLVYTDWMILNNVYDFHGSLLSDYRDCNCWYLRDGPMSWDVKDGCLPMVMQVSRVRHISRMPRALYGFDGNGPTIRSFSFKIQDTNGALAELMQQLPSSIQGRPFDRNFMANLHSVHIDTKVRKDQMPLLTRLSDLLASASQLQSLNLHFNCIGRSRDLPDVWSMISGRHWQHLHTLTLTGGWRVNTKALLDFLRRHSLKLKNLWLSDIYITEDSEESWIDVIFEMQTFLPRLKAIGLDKLSELGDHEFDHLVDPTEEDDDNILEDDGLPELRTAVDCAFRRKHLMLLKTWMLLAHKLSSTEREDLRKKVEALRGPEGWHNYDMMGILESESEPENESEPESDSESDSDFDMDGRPYNHPYTYLYTVFDTNHAVDADIVSDTDFDADVDANDEDMEGGNE